MDVACLECVIFLKSYKSVKLLMKIAILQVKSINTMTGPFFSNQNPILLFRRIRFVRNLTHCGLVMPHGVKGHSQHWCI